MYTVLGHKPSTQPAVVLDTLEDSRVQDAEDDELQQPEVRASPNLDNSNTTAPSPASTSTTDASGDVATISQGEMKESDRKMTEKPTSRKRKKSKLDVTGKMLDQLIGMQVKSDKMMI